MFNFEEDGVMIDHAGGIHPCFWKYRDFKECIRSKPLP